MKRNSVDFHIARRQSYAAIFFFVYKFFKIVVRQIWPLLLAFVFGKESLKFTLLYIIIGISTLILAYSIVAFFKYFFYIENDELIVEKGVFQKSKMNIPFERIQTINFEQSLLHRLLGVVKLEVDTAGSKGNEFTFVALDAGIANELRAKVFKYKSEILQENGSAEELKMNSANLELKDEVVLKLSLTELIKIGLGQNHLRSFLLIIAFFSWIYGKLDKIGMSTDDMIELINEETILYGKLAILVLAVFAMVLTLGISLSRTILKFYNFNLKRTFDGFKIESGLLNRRQVAAKDHKIQIVAWSDNPIKRWMDIYDVVLKQASSVEVRNKKSIIIPGCDGANLERIKNYYFLPDEWEGMERFTISRLFIPRRMIYIGLIPFLAIFLAVYHYYGILFAPLSLIWLVTIYFASRTRYAKWYFEINAHLLHIHQGLFGNYNKTLKLYKVQNIELEQSIYQRMNNLANIIIYTASGKVKIPFVPFEIAKAVLDFILYKIESDKRSWM